MKKTVVVIPCLASSRQVVVPVMILTIGSKDRSSHFECLAATHTPHRLLRPWRKLGHAAVGLQDGRIRLVPAVEQSDDGHRFAASRVRRMPDAPIIATMMSFVLR